MKKGLVIFQSGFSSCGSFIYDQTPQPLERAVAGLPDSFRIAFTINFGYTKERLEKDVADKIEKFSGGALLSRSLSPSDPDENTGPSRGGVVGFILGCRF